MTVGQAKYTTAVIGCLSEQECSLRWPNPKTMTADARSMLGRLGSKAVGLCSREQLQLRFCSNARRRIWPLTNWHVTNWACAASNQSEKGGIRSHSDRSFCVLDTVNYAMAITICVAVGN